MIAQDLERDVYTCASCGYCRFNCPVSQQLGFERASARGRMLLVKRVLDGALPFSRDLIELLYACTECAGCSETCPTGVDYVGIVTALRREAVRQGLLPGPQTAARDVLSQHGNPFAQKSEERGDWVPKSRDLSAKTKDLYFVGCSGSYASNRIPRSVLAVLDAAGHPVGLLGARENCCGDTYFRFGEDERGEELVRKNTALFEEAGAERLIAACPGCLRALRGRYPAKFEVLHVSELMAEMVKSGALKFVKPLARKVIYSDGCDLGRHSGVYEAPREVLRAIPEIKLVEFDYNRAEAACCGGPVASGSPDLAHRIAAEKVREAADKGAEIIATSCPMCMVNLKEGAKLAGINVEVQEASMLLPKLVEKRA